MGAMEARLKRFGVEYHKFIVPGTSAAQIFLWDPEGCALPAVAHAAHVESAPRAARTKMCACVRARAPGG